MSGVTVTTKKAIDSAIEWSFGLVALAFASGIGSALVYALWVWVLTPSKACA